MPSLGKEDIVLAELCTKLEIGTGRFLDIGAGGRWSNTDTLIPKGWEGMSIDLAPQAKPSAERSILVRAIVTPDNILKIAGAWLSAGVDVCSVDIDGYDLPLVQTFLHHAPRIFILEYNSAFPWKMSFHVPYLSGFRWRGGLYMGASLRAWHDLLSPQYDLVTFVNDNAFFVRKGCLPPLSEPDQSVRQWLMQAKGNGWIKFREARLAFEQMNLEADLRAELGRRLGTHNGWVLNIVR